MPLLAERLRNLHEVGRVLAAEYGGSFANCVRECAGDADRLVRLVVAKFPCFRDSSPYGGETGAPRPGRP